MSTSSDRTFVIYVICLIVFVNKCVLGNAASEVHNKSFPSNFLWGVATSAYQIEGHHNENGAGEITWDYYRKKFPEKFSPLGSDDHIFCDSLNKWEDDVKLISDLGVRVYRFSISWSRILPDGYSNNINKEGIKYYNDLINALVAKNITPVVTMYQHDLPMPLQKLGGWTNVYMLFFFEDYAKILYKNFGDRVKIWITMNGACKGYGDNDPFPPFLNDSAVARYLCYHVALLSHAKAYHLYENQFKMRQKGHVGITVDIGWFEPKSSSKEDVEAAERARQFHFGMILNPILHRKGNYPESVIKRINRISDDEGFIASKLPVFTTEEADFVQDTYDFLGVNIYTTFLVEDFDMSSQKPSFEKDVGVKLSHDKAWASSASNWLKVDPGGLRKILKWVKDTYGRIDIVITENGFSDHGEIEDIDRIKYHKAYLSSLLESIYEDKVSVEGYIAWSLLDNFEWTAGFSQKFGLYHVNFTDPARPRTPKLSASWYKEVVKTGKIVDIPTTSGV